jgi:prefoldin subunit 5
MTTKLLEEKTAALNFFKQEMKDVNEEHLSNKAVLDQSLSQVQRLTQENAELRTEIEKLRQRIVTLRQSRNRNLQKMK